MSLFFGLVKNHESLRIYIYESMFVGILNH